MMWTIGEEVIGECFYILNCKITYPRLLITVNWQSPYSALIYAIIIIKSKAGMFAYQLSIAKQSMAVA